MPVCRTSLCCIGIGSSTMQCSLKIENHLPVLLSVGQMIFKMPMIMQTLHDVGCLAQLAVQRMFTVDRS